MISVLGDQYMRDQRLGGDAALHDPHWCRCLYDRALAGAATITRAPREQHAIARRHDIETLGHVLTNLVECTTTTGTGLRFNIDHLFDPLAMFAYACLPVAAHAQEVPNLLTAEDTNGGGLSEIIVTAQKRRENLQETPISISVLRSDDLTNRHVQSLTDLGDGAIPSLRVAPFFSRPGALIVNVRGVGVLSDSNQPARDQGVGVYIDGVYMGRPQGLGAALYDIENIEVLKGPQGTLFGRNTEGGALNIVTTRPSGEFKMNTTVGAGNFGSYKAETHIDLPEFSGFSIKLDGIVTAW